MARRKAHFTDDTRVFVDAAGTITDGYAALPSACWTPTRKAVREALAAVPEHGVARVWARNAGGYAGEHVERATGILDMLHLVAADFDTRTPLAFGDFGRDNGAGLCVRVATVPATGATITAQDHYVSACLDAGYTLYPAIPSATRPATVRPIGVFDGVTLVGLVMPCRPAV